MSDSYDILVNFPRAMSFVESSSMLVDCFYCQIKATLYGIVGSVFGNQSGQEGVSSSGEHLF